MGIFQAVFSRLTETCMIVQYCTVMLSYILEYRTFLNGDYWNYKSLKYCNWICVERHLQCHVLETTIDCPTLEMVMDCDVWLCVCIALHTFCCKSCCRLSQNFGSSYAVCSSSRLPLSLLWFQKKCTVVRCVHLFEIFSNIKIDLQRIVDERTKAPGARASTKSSA